MVTVFVYPYGKTEAVPAGTYYYDAEARMGYFSYLKEYLTSLPQFVPFAIDPVSLPISTKTFSTQDNEALHGVLRDSIPDYWGRLVLEKLTGRPVEDMDPEFLLLNSDASRVGNLDFRKSPDSAEAAFEPPVVESLDDLVEAAALIEKDSTLSSHLQLLLRHGTSMGGARPKCLIQDGDSLWLAKLPAKDDRWNNARVEMATMQLASFCGITTPEMRIVDTEKHAILLLKRFDREKTEHGYLRRGYLSAMSVMGVDERDRARHSYVFFADTLRSAFPRDWSRQQGEELFRRLVFNILVRNIDDHARNHGILLPVAPNTKMELSPAFDIVPTPAQPGVSTDFMLAMAVGPHGRIADIDNALAGAAHFGLHRQRAVEMTREIGEKVSNWRAFFENAGVNEEDAEKFTATFISAQKEKARTMKE
jgi:serine/threonine-protein kinase HipA